MKTSTLAMKQSMRAKPILRPRFQVSVAGNVGLGPGKAQLLELIRETGSLAEAATRMGMSYMRAWTLVRTMNDSFREPLVVAIRGGKNQGGSHLTEAGQAVLALYRQMEVEARDATKETWDLLQRMLKH